MSKLQLKSTRASIVAAVAPVAGRKRSHGVTNLPEVIDVDSWNVEDWNLSVASFQDMKNISKPQPYLEEPEILRGLDYLEKYTPTNTSQLAVNKQRVDDLRRWLTCGSVSNGFPPSPVLVISGPSGSCKATTLQVLLREFKVRCLPWCDEEVGGNLNDERRRFTEFMARISEQHCNGEAMGFLEMSKSESVSTTNQDQYQGTLVILRSIPLECKEDITTLRQALQGFIEALGSNTKTDMSHSLRCVLLLTTEDVDPILPQIWRQEWRVQLIKFNSLTDTFMKKALLQAASVNTSFSSANSRGSTRRGNGRVQTESLSNEACAAIIAQSQGDMRAALHALLLQRVAAVTVSLEKKKGPRECLQPTQQSNVPLKAYVRGDTKDPHLSWYHALARILNGKRVPDTAHEYTFQLPQHLKHLKRAPLEFIPEEVLELCENGGGGHLSSSSSENVIHFLQENYLDFMSPQWVEQMASVADYFSAMESLCNGHWRPSIHSAGGSPHEENWNEFGAIVAVRGLLWSQTLTSDLGTVADRIKPTWRPLRGPLEYSARMLSLSRSQHIHRWSQTLPFQCSQSRWWHMGLADCVLDFLGLVEKLDKLKSYLTADFLADWRYRPGGFVNKETGSSEPCSTGLSRVQSAQPHRFVGEMFLPDVGMEIDIDERSGDEE